MQQDIIAIVTAVAARTGMSNDEAHLKLAPIVERYAPMATNPSEIDAFAYEMANHLQGTAAEFHVEMGGKVITLDDDDVYDEFDVLIDGEFDATILHDGIEVLIENHMGLILN